MCLRLCRIKNIDSNIFNSQQVRFMSELTRQIRKQQPIAFNHSTFNHSQYYTQNAKFPYQQIVFKNAQKSFTQSIPTYQNGINRVGMEKMPINNPHSMPMKSKIIPNSTIDLLTSKNHTKKLTSNYPNNSYQSKPKNFSNSKYNKKKSPSNQIYSQRLEMVGNISPRQNPEGKARFLKTYHNYTYLNHKSDNKKLKTEGQGEFYDTIGQTPVGPVSNIFSKKPKDKKAVKHNQNSQQLIFKKVITSFPLCLKSRSKTFEVNQQMKQNHQKNKRQNILRDPHELQINIEDALQFRDTQTRRGSQCSSSRNEKQLKSPVYFKTRQNTNMNKQTTDTQQMKSSLIKATKQLTNQTVVNKLLKQRLSSIQKEYKKKQQHSKKLQKQLSTLKKKKREPQQSKSKQKQIHLQQRNPLVQYEAERKWLKQQIVLLNMTHKKFASLIQQKDNQIHQLTKKLQEKQFYCEKLEKQNTIKGRNYDFSKDNDSEQILDENATSMIIRNDLSNDFDPLEGYNIQLDYLKMENTNLLELIRKAEEEIQMLKNQNIKLRYQNQNAEIQKQINKQGQNKKFSSSNKNTGRKTNFDFTIQQCYKQVLKVFGISTDIDNQFPRCHNQLMNEIDYFKKSLLDVLQQIKQVDVYHKPQTCKRQKKQNIIGLANQLKAKMQQSMDINNEKFHRFDIDENLTKEELQKILFKMNERIQKLEPQIENKFSDLLKRLYNIVRVLCERFGHELETQLIQLIHKDEVLAEYVPF